MKQLACVLVCLLLTGCNQISNGQTDDGGSLLGEATKTEVRDCVDRGGHPVVFGGGHTNRTVVCFAKEVLR